MQKLNILTPDGVKQIDGEVLTCNNTKVIVYKTYEHGFWFVHDYESGLIITANDNKVAAGTGAKIILKSMDISRARLKAEFEASKIPYPLNREDVNPT